MSTDITPKNIYKRGELSPGNEAELQALLRETEPISIISCTELVIGSWHRIAGRTRRHDLVAYISDYKACLTWFIHSGGLDYKMEIPISSIVSTEFVHSTHPGQGVASFYLAKRPTFYMGAGNSAWQVCDDWTEDRQASQIIKHQLIGNSVELNHAIRVIEARRKGLGRPIQIPQLPVLNFPPASQVQ
ncbi:hypothetical protein CTheo_7713 [Ceratobasidium theobromae]|uniref:TRF2/HOY1 PH-like domain-containing protein n=1 Tax=Ceratobasidium theobromae TaxID=1582974 RepID=A0A5N5QBP4_9AGAM|nr:hypothetical protein CTheo_7713 [Ceratobasidium theobromae]